MKLTNGLFVTGTDTDIGKTWFSVALMRALQHRGLDVAGMKPVAAGCDWVEGLLRNQDALLLQKYSSLCMDYADINPYAFESAVSPHIACGNTVVNLAKIVEAYSNLQGQVNVVIVEGAGGWFSPLSKNFDNASLAIALQLPVIIVVGLRLGCINHALLTWRALQAASVECAGWVAVTLDPEMSGLSENIDFLKSNIDAPFLGLMPYLSRPDFDVLAGRISTSGLIADAGMAINFQNGTGLWHQ